MTYLSNTHICFLTFTAAFLVLSTYAVSTFTPKKQNIMFLLAALGCAAGIFYLYGFKGGSFTPGVLGMHMLQVPAFNMLLVLMMMLPGFELARQYSVMFSMFATLAYLIFIPDSWASLSWQDPTVWVFWLSNLCAIALPIWMIGARCLKPNRKFITPVLVCVVVYFSVSYMLTAVLTAKGILASENAFSLFFHPGSCAPLVFLYSKIPHAFVYLLPIIPALYIFFRLWTMAFHKYGSDPYDL